ncbi:hypothetical protein EYF80_017247 [Liparis tanakae]|uniref:Uncharacterized protein n=1 Tax=Liparis tanakae TaxID=230148 RepID=A0A4Z2I3X9_9TELE|nr:hypothetical protein EYF80_017247 [Liparis tanakae]
MVFELNSDLALSGLVPDERVLEKLLCGWSARVGLHQTALDEVNEFLGPGRDGEHVLALDVSVDDFMGVEMRKALSTDKDVKMSVTDPAPQNSITSYVQTNANVHVDFSFDLLFFLLRNIHHLDGSQLPRLHVTALTDMAAETYSRSYQVSQICDEKHREGIVRGCYNDLERYYLQI